MRVSILALLLALGLAGCGTRPAARPPGADPPIRLTATLVKPTEVTLTWRDTQRGVAGHVVEFATNPRGPYTVLRFAPPGETTFTHPDLMPETSFYYRVRAYYGPTSRSIDVTVPGGRRAGKDATRDDDWATPRHIGGPADRHTVRDGSAAATPTDLRGTVMAPNGIRFTWTDHAGDEDGYLLESRPRGRPDFQVVAVIDPDIDSFGLITLPEERVASYRVRAFAYGRSSDLAVRKTGADPADR
ncbi:hypothetical protein GCM10023196_022800 [Actinoallomurus vinaceus]|uniref:Fibronectin type-III domain-containing protein n=1 Tax=Actinoallomurus vinaceus TaxID=1080074 RepID=A0ABP8U761_9ACTN